MKYNTVVAIVASAFTVQANTMDKWITFPRYMHANQMRKTSVYLQPTVPVASVL